MTIRPYVVEFIGTPEAGKTSTINQLSSMFKKEYISSLVVQESAELLPKHMPKKSNDADLWIRLHTLGKVISAYYLENYDIILIDHGCVDSRFWTTKYYEDNLLSKEEYNTRLHLFDSKFLPDLVITLVVSPEVAISRKGSEGTIVNKAFISDFNCQLLKFYDTIEISKIKFDTSSFTKEETLSKVYKSILYNYYMFCNQ